MMIYMMIHDDLLIVLYLSRTPPVVVRCSFSCLFRQRERLCILVFYVVALTVV